VFFVIPPLTNLLPTSLTDHFVQYLPSNAGAVMLDGTFGVAHPLTPWTGFGVMCSYAVVRCRSRCRFTLPVTVMGTEHDPPKNSPKEGTMSLATPYPTRLEFHGTPQIARWRPLVQWLLAIPHLFIAYALTVVRAVLTLIAFITVLCTRRIPRPLFDAIAMTFRYEWRTVSYALFLRADYPPFDFRPTAADDGADPHTLVTFTYPEQLSRWQPLVKWLLAVPHYLVLLGLSIAAIAVLVAGFFAVLITGEYPQPLRDFLVAVYRYGVEVQAYTGLLTDRYPPFSLQAG
jgi:hypothetical protein